MKTLAGFVAVAWLVAPVAAEPSDADALFEIGRKLLASGASAAACDTFSQRTAS